MELNEAVLALARAIHAGGTDGWRSATVKLRCTPSGFAGRTGYDNGRALGGGPAMRALEQDVAKAVLADRDNAVFELVVRATGEVAFAYTHDFDINGPNVVRDKDFRLPGHPLPGSIPMPDDIRVTDAPTDPDVLARIAAKIDPTEGRGEDEILATERELGFRLPEELRALHRLGCADIGEFRLATLEELVEWRTDEDTQFGGWDDDEPLGLDPVSDVWPHGHVKRLCRNDWWLPFAVDDNWFYLAADLDPAEHGRTGQVIWFSEGTEMSGYHADSIEGVLPPWTWPDDARSAEVVLRGEPTPDPHIQKVYANQGGDIDLASFAVLPNLRDLRVNGANRVTAAALLGLEALKVEAREFDLAPLTGHPTLWSLALSGLRHPVDARTIATMTSLIRLDLSGVEVTDIEALAALPNLKVVTLDGDQWDRVELPGLAVAALGKGTLAQQLRWLDRYAPKDRNRELHQVEVPNLMG